MKVIFHRGMTRVQVVNEATSQTGRAAESGRGHPTGGCW
jgi:hypothetical protein